MLKCKQEPLCKLLSMLLKSTKIGKLFQKSWFHLLAKLKNLNLLKILFAKQLMKFLQRMVLTKKHSHIMLVLWLKFLVQLLLLTKLLKKLNSSHLVQMTLLKWHSVSLVMMLVNSLELTMQTRFMNLTHLLNLTKLV